MKANNITAFVSGAFTSLAGIIIESNGYNFAWLMIMFFPLMFFFVVGLDIWKSHINGELFLLGKRHPIMVTPIKIYGPPILRCLIFFLGAGSIGVCLDFFQKI